MKKLVNEAAEVIVPDQGEMDYNLGVMELFEVLFNQVEEGAVSLERAGNFFPTKLID